MKTDPRASFGLGAFIEVRCESGPSRHILVTNMFDVDGDHCGPDMVEGLVGFCPAFPESPWTAAPKDAVLHVLYPGNLLAPEGSYIEGDEQLEDAFEQAAEYLRTHAAMPEGTPVQ